jgi:activating signal cointegrator complex subunit 3
VLQVKLTCNHKSKSIYAQAPRYPKPKLEGWFIALGDSKSGELMALKKINQISSRIKTESIWFEVPDTKSILSLYFISDSYIGLDQVYDIRIDPIKS